MALSFLYVIMRALLRIFLGSLRSEYAKEVEIVILQHPLAILADRSNDRSILIPTERCSRR